MTSWIILLIKQFIDIIKYILIGNAVFDLKKCRNLNFKDIIVFTVSIILIYALLYNHITNIWINLNAIICFIYLFITFKDGIIKTFKIVTICILVTALCDQVIALVFGNAPMDEYTYKFILSNIIRLIFVLFVSWTIKLIKKVYNNQYNLLDMSWYIYMNIVFGFSATLFPLYIARTYKYIINSRVIHVITVVSYFNVLISILSIVLFIKNKQEKEKYYLDNKMKDKTLKLQEDYYQKLIDNYSNIRRFKHDIKGHLNLINGLIADSKYEKAKLYLSEISENITNKDIYNTNNIYISTILNSFDEQLKDYKIIFELSYYITRKLKMDSMDICSLFYNLLLNAIEANLKIRNGRYIKLYIADIKNNMVIKIINPIDHDFDIKYIQENITSKEDKTNHGFGLVTINNIINKYKGNIDYTIVKNALIIDIILINVLESKDH